MPYDMSFLFDYIPIIEADLQHPATQLKHVIENYETYIPLVEKNYKEISEKHQWVNRVN